MTCAECEWYSREPGLYCDDPKANKCDKADTYLDDRWCSDPETPEWCPLQGETK